jgi:branched-chain amino acid transport system permease protein
MLGKGKVPVSTNRVILNFLGLLVFLVAIPMLLPWSLAVDILIYSIAALAFGLLLGQAGMLSFGQAAFFAIGAYAAGYCVKEFQFSLIPALLVASALGALAAAGVAMLTARLKDVYFILMTLAFAQMVYFIVMTWRSVTGGPSGLSGFDRPLISFGFATIPLGTPLAFYLFAAVVLGLVFIVYYLLVLSPVGLVLRGIKDNADRLEAIGYPVWRYKLFVFTVSGALTGLAGALSAFQWLIVPVSKASMNESANIVFMSILGGVSAPLGPVAGTTVFIVLSDIISTYWARWPILFGGFIILIVFFMRGGIIQGVSLLFSALARLVPRRA